MKFVGRNILFFVIAPIIVGLALWYFQRDYVDLQYSLSEPLPTKFLSESGAQTVQQLTVINRGNIPANDVKIETKSAINRFDVEKNVATDNIVIDRDRANFSAVYDSLAAGSKIKIVFELNQGLISSEDITVSHSKGPAVEVFSDSSDSFGWLSTISIGIPLFYVFLAFLELRSGSLSRLKSNSVFEKPQDFLSSRKPIMLTESQWEEVRKEYVKKYDFSRLFMPTDLESSDIYNFLNSTKPDYFSDGEWSLFTDNARSQFRDIIEVRHARYVGTHMLEELLFLKKPELFSSQEWTDFRDKVSDSVVSYRLTRIMPIPSLDYLERHFVDEKPAGVSEKSWEKFRSTIQSVFYVKVVEECLSEYKPISRFESINKKLLNNNDVQKLLDLAYKVQFHLEPRLSIFSYQEAERFLESEKPEWLKGTDLEKLKEKASLIKSSHLAKKEYDSLTSRIEAIFEGYALGDKPNAVSHSRWREFCKFYQIINEKIHSLESDQLEVAQSKADVGEFKSRLLKQLSIIDRVLSEPSFVDKVEDFDNPFSKGNFENLKKVSEILSSSL
tara:strand:+ start:806 stop:2476 length:1671 start_codon:yes stop_codon:yes gene_type:complete